jgi:ferredoxin
MELFSGDNMAYKITEECVACGNCIDECPVSAISEGTPIYTIDAEACIDCGACAGACPSDAIIQE